LRPESSFTAPWSWEVCCRHRRCEQRRDREGLVGGEGRGALASGEGGEGSLAGGKGKREAVFRSGHWLLCRSMPRDGSGSGLERISTDFGYVGCRFGSDFHPRVHGFEYPQHCGFGADSIFCPWISVGALKILSQ
jgi:hypothetical protein